MSRMIHRNRLPTIVLDGCQFKSVGKLKLAAEHLHVLEVELGIHTTQIELRNCFICPDITDAELDTLRDTRMERLISGIVKTLRLKS